MTSASLIERGRGRVGCVAIIVPRREVVPLPPHGPVAVEGAATANGHIDEIDAVD